MKYISTRGGIEPVGFADAVMMGLATDGGLLLPTDIPDVRDRLADWRHLPYPDLAVEIIRLFTGDDLPEDDLQTLIRRSYATFRHPSIAPVVDLAPVHVMELFHGPTLAFKDVALQLLGNLFEYLLERSGGHLNILGATSGDTGSAAIHGVRGKHNIRICILHPHGRVSPLQERQMTTVLDDNVHNIAIEGSFDDGQQIVKTLFADVPFKTRYRLGAVNSVNWARVLAQIVYYFYGAFRVQEATGADRVRVCVPTGNFGNVFAGYLATRMGAPIARLVLATNENDILSRFFTAGDYSIDTVRPTHSPSMDIQVASNFERYLYYLLGTDADRLNEAMRRFKASGALRLPAGQDGVDPLFVSGAGSNADTLVAISRYADQHGYILDPHTAVGVHVAEQFLDDAEPMLCLATAHPAKFPEAVMQAVGEAKHHPDLDALLARETRCARLPPDIQAVRRFIVERMGE